MKERKCRVRRDRHPMRCDPGEVPRNGARLAACREIAIHQGGGAGFDAVEEAAIFYQRHLIASVMPQSQLRSDSVARKLMSLMTATGVARRSRLPPPIATTQEWRQMPAWLIVSRIVARCRWSFFRFFAAGNHAYGRGKNHRVAMFQTEASISAESPGWQTATALSTTKIVRAGL